jgi:hypothetical protein
MRLLALAASVLLGGAPGPQTISGTVTANSGASITVSSADRSLTCAIAGTKAQAAILLWGTGARAAMACKPSKGGFVLWKLMRLGVKEGTTTTTPATTTTETRTAVPPPPQQQRQAAGVVVGLRADGVGVKPDAGAEALTCAITPAPDSQAAASKLSLGARVAIVCRLDGGRYVLAGATPLN